MRFYYLKIIIYSRSENNAKKDKSSRPIDYGTLSKINECKQLYFIFNNQKMKILLRVLINSFYCDINKTIFTYLEFFA